MELNRIQCRFEYDIIRLNKDKIMMIQWLSQQKCDFLCKLMGYTGNYYKLNILGSALGFIVKGCLSYMGSEWCIYI